MVVEVEHLNMQEVEQAGIQMEQIHETVSEVILLIMDEKEVY